MASNAVNLSDFMRALAQDSEVQRELRMMLFPSDLAGLQSTVKALAEGQGEMQAGIVALTGKVEALAEAQQRTELQVQSLAEAQQRTEAQVQNLAEAQQRTEAQVQNLAEAQQRTEAQVQNLAEAQQRTEVQVQNLAGKVEVLAEGQQRTELQIQVLTEAQQRTEAQVQNLAGKVEVLAEGQREMQASIAALAQSMTEMDRRHMVRLDRLDGFYLEAQYRERPYSFFGTLVHKARAVPLVTLADKMSAGLADHEFKDLLKLDLLVNGNLSGHPDKPEIWLAVEVSVVVDSKDVERAERRAAALQKLGLHTIPVAAGEKTTQGAVERARDHGVLLLQNGRTSFWEEALLAHPG